MFLRAFPPNADARRGYSIGVAGLDRSKIELRDPDSDYGIDSDFYSEGRAVAPGYLEATGVRKLLLVELARKQDSFSSKRSAERCRFLDNGVGRQPERFIYKNNLRKCINSIGERESGQHYFTSGVPWSKFPSKKFIDSIQDGDGYGPWYQCICRDMIASTVQGVHVSS